MTDTDNYIQRLEESGPLRDSVLRAAVRALQPPVGSSGLDVGCGIGLQASLLAEAIGPSGRVTGLDLSPEILAHAVKIVGRSGLADCIGLQAGDMCRLPYADQTFDWVWSADCVGYPVGELLPVLKELARVTKPGGSVAILAWSSQQLLPGYPLLEARLNATCSAFAPYASGVRPEAHFLRALRSFRQAGLTEVRVKTLVGDAQAPFGRGIRCALTALFEMLWGQEQPGVSGEIWREYQRLCRPESPDFILDLPDYYAFFTYTMFWGQKERHG